MTAWCGILLRRLAGVIVELAALQQGVLAGEACPANEQALCWASIWLGIFAKASAALRPKSGLLASASKGPVALLPS